VPEGLSDPTKRASLAGGVRVPRMNMQPQTSITESRIIEQKAYRDTWGRGLDSYLQWFYETVILLHGLLSETGTIYIHLDWHVAHYARAVLDEVFGRDNFINEVVWKRKGGSANPSNRYGVVTDTIFLYAKSDSYIFHPKFTLSSDEVKQYIKERFTNIDEKGRKYMKSPIVSPNPRPNLTYEYKGYNPPRNGWSITKDVMEQWDREDKLYFPDRAQGERIYRKIYLDEYQGQPIQNLWTDVFVINPVANERLDYPTQKPEALLDRIISASTEPDDLVLDCFCGSGTTAAVAEKLHRRWITCDLGRFAVHTTRKRLLGIQGVRPFVVQNLGKYERQLWQADEFGPQAAQRVAAYTKFILDLYHAQPLSGRTWLHGVKGNRVVHVGSIDSPVTLADVRSIIIEWQRNVGKSEVRTTGIDVLGWDFAFELNEVARQQALDAGVDLKFYTIPREVLEKKAVEQGDIQFFELAALFVDTRVSGRTLTLELTNFVPPLDYVPQEIRSKITRWESWIDYWAVDFDFKGDTFHNEWQSYRTKANKAIATTTTNTYDSPGTYCVNVKVIDILGNDTTRTLQVEIA